MPRVEASMRRGLLFTSLAIACTTTVPADDYALEDERMEVWSEGQVVPDGERAAIVESEPEVGGTPRIRLSFDEGCHPSYTSIGFPAIDLEAGVVVVPLAHMLQLSYAPGELDLVWFDAASGDEIDRDVLLTDEFVLPDGYEEEDEMFHCGGRSAGLRRAVRVVNRKLRARSWVTMVPLPVELFDTSFGEGLYREEVAPRDRPVQVLAQYGYAVTRILGVKLLERHELPDYHYGMVHRVYAHRPSGTVLFGTRGCEGDSCTCDPRSRAAVFHWRLETFAAIDAHPCVAEPDPDAENGTTCDDRPLPFPDDGDTPLWAI